MHMRVQTNRQVWQMSSLSQVLLTDNYFQMCYPLFYTYELCFGDDYVDFKRFEYWEEESNLSIKTALTRLQLAWSRLVPPAVSDFFWYK